MLDHHGMPYKGSLSIWSDLRCLGLPLALYFGPLTRNLPAKSSAAIVKNNEFGLTGKFACKIKDRRLA
jgi:hypothetical protein